MESGIDPVFKKRLLNFANEGSQSLALATIAAGGDGDDLDL